MCQLPREVRDDEGVILLVLRCKWFCRFIFFHEKLSSIGIKINLERERERERERELTIVEGSIKGVLYCHEI